MEKKAIIDIIDQICRKGKLLPIEIILFILEFLNKCEFRLIGLCYQQNLQFIDNQPLYTGGKECFFDRLPFTKYNNSSKVRQIMIQDCFLNSYLMCIRCTATDEDWRSGQMDYVERCFLEIKKDKDKEQIEFPINKEIIVNLNVYELYDNNDNDDDDVFNCCSIQPNTNEYEESKYGGNSLTISGTRKSIKIHINKSLLNGIDLQLYIPLKLTLEEYKEVYGYYPDFNYLVEECRACFSPGGCCFSPGGCWV
jgi:hypothetical protein